MSQPLQRLLTVAVLVVGGTGCAIQNLPQPPVTAVSNQARSEMTVLAIRGPYEPTIQVSGDEIARRGQLVGAKAKEAGIGSITVGVQAGAESGDPFGFLALATLGIVAAPVSALGGAIYGGAISDTDEAIQSSVPRVRKALSRAPAHLTAELMAELEDPALRTPRWQLIEPTVSDEELRKRGFDAVLDLRMTHLTTIPSENLAQVRVQSLNTATVTDLDDGRVLAQRGYHASTPDRKFSSWADDDATPLLEALDDVFDDISRDLVDDMFRDRAIRVVGLEPIAQDSFRRGRIDGLRPMILWHAEDADAPLPEGYPVRYELLLYTGSRPPEAGIRLDTDRYVPPELLKRCTRYRWKVRAHYLRFGEPDVSSWSPEYRFGTPCD